MDKKQQPEETKKEIVKPGNKNEAGTSPEASTASTEDIPVEKNIAAIMELEKKAFHSRSPAEHVADRVTKFAGSAPFIILHIIWFGLWILANEDLIPDVKPFDPFPFSFLTLVVSLEAIFLTLLVLMSQNRMNKEADKRAHLDLQVNMLNEQESTMTLKIVEKIADHLGLGKEIDDSMRQLIKDTDVNKVAKSLEEKSPE